MIHISDHMAIRSAYFRFLVSNKQLFAKVEYSPMVLLRNYKVQ